MFSSVEYSVSIVVFLYNLLLILLLCIYCSLSSFVVLGDVDRVALFVLSVLRCVVEGCVLVVHSSVYEILLMCSIVISLFNFDLINYF